MVNKGKRLTGINPLAYLGVEPLSPPQMDVYQRDPTPQDWQGYNLGSLWLNEIAEDLWLLVSLESNIAKWILFTGGSGTVVGLRANDGGIAVPNTGIVNVYGDGVSITTYALTNPPNTLNIVLDGNIANSYVTQAGTAIPVAGVLNIFGDTGVLTTTGTGNTVTVDLTPSTNGQVIIGRTGGNPAWGNITSTGGTILITNGANTLDIETQYNPATIPAFSATNLNSTQTNATGDGTVFTPVVYGTVIQNGTAYNPATGVFVAPVTGFYCLSATVQYSNLSSGHTSGYIAFETNGGPGGFFGTIVNPFSMSTQGGLSMGFLTLDTCITIQLTAGESVQVAATVSGGTKTVSIGGGSGAMIFSGFLVN
jgi:hypothetical protein